MRVRDLFSRALTSLEEPDPRSAFVEPQELRRAPFSRCISR
jgi:hypothetical protein